MTDGGEGDVRNPFIAKLSLGVQLQESDRSRLLEVMSRQRDAPPGVDLISEGDKPENVRLILKGWAFRYKVLADGKRQIMSILLPGDFCDLHIAILKRMDHSIGVLSPVRVVEIPRSTILELTSHHPGITRALWWATLVEEAVMREWLVNMGQRQADRAMCHIFCELLVRLRVVGLARGSSYEFPMTQEDLGDVLGLSSIHVNRTLQEVRSAGLISLQGGVLTIHDEAALARMSGFKPDYLHLDVGED